MASGRARDVDLHHVLRLISSVFKNSNARPLYSDTLPLHVYFSVCLSVTMKSAACTRLSPKQCCRVSYGVFKVDIIMLKHFIQSIDIIICLPLLFQLPVDRRDVYYVCRYNGSLTCMTLMLCMILISCMTCTCTCVCMNNYLMLRLLAILILVPLNVCVLCENSCNSCSLACKFAC